MNIVELKLGRMWMRRNRQKNSFIQSCLVRRLVSIYCVALLLLFSFLPIITVQISGGLGSSIGSPKVSGDPLGSNVPDGDSDEGSDDGNFDDGESSDNLLAGGSDDGSDDGDYAAGGSDDDPIKNDPLDDSDKDDLLNDGHIGGCTTYDYSYYTNNDTGTAGDIVTLNVGVGDITAGNRIEVAIKDTQGSACVNRIDFTSNKNLADVHVHVTRLKERPEEIQKEPKRNGTVYEYLDLKITTGDIYLSNMNTRIRFNVSKEWINENDIDISTIRLMRYHNDTWQELNTTFLLDKNTTNASFIAETPGFSTFAVVGSANVMSSDTYAPETANIPLEAIIGIITAIVALLIIVLFKARYIYFGDNHTVEKPKKKN